MWVGFGEGFGFGFGFELAHAFGFEFDLRIGFDLGIGFEIQISNSNLDLVLKPNLDLDLNWHSNLDLDLDLDKAWPQIKTQCNSNPHPHPSPNTGSNSNFKSQSKFKPNFNLWVKHTTLYYLSTPPLSPPSPPGATPICLAATCCFILVYPCVIEYAASASQTHRPAAVVAALDMHLLPLLPQWLAEVVWCSWLPLVAAQIRMPQNGQPRQRYCLARMLAVVSLSRMSLYDQSLKSDWQLQQRR
jgi:hypothetical protein